MDAPNDKSDRILIASGSEVALVVAAGRQLAAKHIAAQGWPRHVGEDGDLLGVDRFGESAL